MSEDSRIAITQPFDRLFMAGSQAASVSREEIQVPYGYCEDLANMLVETAKARLWQLGLSVPTYLATVPIEAGLQGGVASAQEAWWVAKRLSELLDWAT
jgi:hypothetical protein